MRSLEQPQFSPSPTLFGGGPNSVQFGQRNGRPFSFSFFNEPRPTTTAEASWVIIENNGIFCIADIFDTGPLVMDMEFKQLVDSVIGQPQAVAAPSR